MRYAVSLPPFGDFANPRFLAEATREAEAAGWDAFFIWDHMFFDPTFHPIADPWVALAACAMTTERIRLGTMVTPIARRRPWKLARETVSLDQMSNGRLTLGVGLGDPVQWDYGFFHEEQDAKVRAGKLDEGLDILRGLWTGEFFSYSGQHFQIEKMRFLPRPAQAHLPIWVGGNWDKHAPQRRAAKQDGYFPLKWGLDPLNAAEWKVIMDYVNQHRTDPNAPFDWVHGGITPGDNPAEVARILQPLMDVGVNWWIESVDAWRFGWKWENDLTPETTRLMQTRIRQGPPKV